ncbi:hypothetical protein KL905_004479 [Ogataea polymorpha]|nr:hypothetical protein KL937_004152 [Ogataea polymorpha]KAG7896569.1 hypothetical protein KL908_001083 [Ogataea polymorpha]KAG7916750.1 hypothetical protein KL905_004479 [Ogataea polymorpha]KAG7932671.1 hypothetical protein KL904_004462 [Ogataea polymorpha]
MANWSPFKGGSGEYQPRGQSPTKVLSTAELDNEVASIISGLSGAKSNLFGQANSVFAQPVSATLGEELASDSGSEFPNLKGALSAISAPVPQHKSRFANNLFGAASISGVNVSSFSPSGLGSSNFLEKFASVTEKTRELELKMARLNIQNSATPSTGSGNTGSLSSSDLIPSRRSSNLNSTEIPSPQAAFREPRKQSFSEKFDNYVSNTNSPTNQFVAGSPNALSFADVPSEHSSAILDSPHDHAKNSWNPATAPTFQPRGFEKPMAAQYGPPFDPEVNAYPVMPPYGLGQWPVWGQIPPPPMAPLAAGLGPDEEGSEKTDDEQQPSAPAPQGFFQPGLRSMTPFMVPSFSPYGFVASPPPVVPAELSPLQHDAHIAPSKAGSPGKPLKKSMSPKPAKMKKHIVRSPLLEEFRNNKNKEYTLKDIYGHGYEFAKDQHGSRFIQQQLALSNDRDKEVIFNEIRNHAMDLMTDVFGNYVIQKYFEHGNDVQRKVMFESMRGSFYDLSLQMYGCRVVQKGLESLKLEEQLQILDELRENILLLVKDQNGNHVIQKSIECIPISKIPFILDSIKHQIYHLSTHPYGCRVIQRLLEFSDQADQQFILDELKDYVYYLIQDQFGNYVIQHVVEHGSVKYTDEILQVVLENLVELSKHKFASNAVEKCIIHQTEENRGKIYNEIMRDNMDPHGKLDENSCLCLMMKDPFANYVVQKLVELIDDEKKGLLVKKIRDYLKVISKNNYGKHLASIEKLIALSESYGDGARV